MDGWEETGCGGAQEEEEKEEPWSTGGRVGECYWNAEARDAGCWVVICL